MLATVKALELYAKKIKQYINKTHMPIVLKALQK